MKKKRKIIMLPSDSGVIALSGNGNLFIGNGRGTMKPQHLYILSDEKFKEGDKLYSNGDIFEATKEMVDKIMPDGYVLGMYPKKIIATTDADINNSGLQNGKLYMVGVEGTKFEDLRPKQIPQHIIEAYVKKPFDEVEVEYEIEKGLTRITMTPYNKGIKPKLNQDGTLAVTLVEEKMYSREEVENMMMQSYIYGQSDKTDSFHKRESTIKKLIKENL